MPNTLLVNTNNTKCTTLANNSKLIHNSTLQDTHMVLIIEQLTFIADSKIMKLIEFELNYLCMFV